MIRSCLFFGQLGVFLVCFSTVAASAPDSSVQQSSQQWEESLRAQQRWGARNRELASLYLQRFQSNVTAQVIPFADGSGGDTTDQRNRAIIILGRLEDLLAEPALEKLLVEEEDREEWLKKHPVLFPQGAFRPSIGHEPVFFHRSAPMSWHIKFALGRIRARDLKGEAKLDAIARSGGLSWAQVQELGDKMESALNDDGGLRVFASGYALSTLTEFIDILRTMGRQGEDIMALGASHLSYSDTAKSLLGLASLSRTEEAKFWLNGATSSAQKYVDPDDILALGAEIKPILLSALQESLVSYKGDPKIFKDQRSTGAFALAKMFRIASATGDPMYFRILKEFSQIDDKETAYAAALAMGDLQTGRGASLVPLPLLP